MFVFCVWSLVLYNTTGQMGKLGWIGSSSPVSRTGAILSILATMHKQTNMMCGVPQGSILKSLLFNIPILPFDQIVQNNKINNHDYADDTHIYLALYNLEIKEKGIYEMPLHRFGHRR